MAQGSGELMESSDAAALDLLRKIHKNYESADNHEILFTVRVEYPGESPEVQEGKLLQSGERFVLDLGDRKVISDGETVWLYVKSRNEVQINDADFGDDGEYMSPNSIFSLYTSDDYIFALIQESSQKGRRVSEIEAKPTDPDSEYFKLRLTIQDKPLEVGQFLLFAKDGSRITMDMKEHKTNVSMVPGAFSFKESDYPDVLVEDLRF